MGFFREMETAVSLIVDMNADKRTTNLFLMKSSYEPVVILFAYVVLIYEVGPRFMKNRPPYNLKTVILIYNIAQIVLNFLLFIGHLVILPKMSIFCSNVADNEYETYIHYCYVLLKYIDLLETIFFVLRKKDSQVSFLHVYHHIGTLTYSWIACKFFPGGQAYFIALPNTLVHTVMYVYYMLTSQNPEYRKNIWWKRHLTEFQIVSNCIILFAFVSACFSRSCNYPKVAAFGLTPNIVTIIYLFTDFYIRNYLLKKSVKHMD